MKIRQSRNLTFCFFRPLLVRIFRPRHFDLHCLRIQGKAMFEYQPPKMLTRICTRTSTSRCRNGNSFQRSNTQHHLVGFPIPVCLDVNGAPPSAIAWMALITSSAQLLPVTSETEECAALFTVTFCSMSPGPFFHNGVS